MKTSLRLLLFGLGAVALSAASMRAQTPRTDLYRAYTAIGEIGGPLRFVSDTGYIGGIAQEAQIYDPTYPAQITSYVAAAYADKKLVRALACASQVGYTGQPSSYYGFVCEAEAGSRAELTLNSALPGQHFVHFDVTAHASEDVLVDSGRPSAMAIGRLTCRVKVDGFHHWGIGADRNNFPGYFNIPFQSGTYSLVIPMVPGQARLVELELTAYAMTYVQVGSYATSNMNAGNTFSWQGVTRVTDAQGVPITGYTLTDPSGTDWTTPANPGAWSDLGAGLAGTGNVIPAARGVGALRAGDEQLVRLSRAQPSALALLCVSDTVGPTALLGGTLVPGFPLFHTQPVLTGPAGSSGVSFVVPPGIPPGSDLNFQFLVLDPGAPFGVSFSNGLRGRFP